MLSAGSLIAGSNHTCAWNVLGAQCWGLNGSGQLGDGTWTNRSVPTTVTLPSGQTFRDAGSNHPARPPERRRQLLGLELLRPAGRRHHHRRLTPTAVTGLTSTQAMAAGWNHTCAVADGHVRCWGDNTYGQLGDGTWTARSAPVIVSGL